MALSCLIASFVTFESAQALFGGDGMELIQTPHGYRPSRCIIRHEENVEITELKDGSGVYAFYPDSKSTKFIPADPYCIENAKQLLTKRGNETSPGLEAWEDYAYFTCPSEMGNFTSVYQIPDESPKGGSQLLYYFIGFQNDDDASISIVQPVVNYDLSGQYPNGWSMVCLLLCYTHIRMHLSKYIYRSHGIVVQQDRVIQERM